MDVREVLMMHPVVRDSDMIKMRYWGTRLWLHMALL